MKYPPHQIRRYDLWAELDIAADTVVDIVVDIVVVDIVVAVVVVVVVVVVVAVPAGLELQAKHRIHCRTLQRHCIDCCI